MNFDITLINVDEKQNIISYKEPKTYFALSSIFTIFTIPIISVNNARLMQLNMVTISEMVAINKIENANSLVKIISVINRQNFTITRGYKTIHLNSHLKTVLLFLIQVTPTHLRNWNGYL